MFYYDHHADKINLCNPQWRDEYINRYKENPTAISWLKRYIEFLTEHELLPSDDLVKLKSLKIKIKKKELPVGDIISKSEFDYLIRNIEDIRDYLIICLNYFGGIRVERLVNLKISDFRFHDWMEHPEEPGQIEIHDAKGGKGRIVVIPPLLMQLCKKYCDELISIEGFTISDQLFDIGVRRYEIILKKYGERILNKRLYPHKLRRSMCTRLAMGGMDVFHLQQFMGHNDIKSTERYVKINIKDVSEKYNEIIKD